MQLQIHAQHESVIACKNINCFINVIRGQVQDCMAVQPACLPAMAC